MPYRKPSKKLQGQTQQGQLETKGNSWDDQVQKFNERLENNEVFQIKQVEPSTLECVPTHWITMLDVSISMFTKDRYRMRYTNDILKMFPDEMPMVLFGPTEPCGLDEKFPNNLSVQNELIEFIRTGKHSFGSHGTSTKTLVQSFQKMNLVEAKYLSILFVGDGAFNSLDEFIKSIEELDKKGILSKVRYIIVTFPTDDEMKRSKETVDALITALTSFVSQTNYGVNMMFLRPDAENFMSQLSEMVAMASNAMVIPGGHIDLLGHIVPDLPVTKLARMDISPATFKLWISTVLRLVKQNPKVLKNRIYAIIHGILLLKKGIEIDGKSIQSLYVNPLSNLKAKMKPEDSEFVVTMMVESQTQTNSLDLQELLSLVSSARFRLSCVVSMDVVKGTLSDVSSVKMKELLHKLFINPSSVDVGKVGLPIPNQEAFQSDVKPSKTYGEVCMWFAQCFFATISNNFTQMMMGGTLLRFLLITTLTSKLTVDVRVKVVLNEVLKNGDFLLHALETTAKDKNGKEIPILADWVYNPINVLYLYHFLKSSRVSIVFSTEEMKKRFDDLVEPIQMVQSLVNTHKAVHNLLSRQFGQNITQKKETMRFGIYLLPHKPSTSKGGWKDPFPNCPSFIIVVFDANGNPKKHNDGRIKFVFLDNPWSREIFHWCLDNGICPLALFNAGIRFDNGTEKGKVPAPYSDFVHFSTSTLEFLGAVNSEEDFEKVCKEALKVCLLSKQNDPAEFEQEVYDGNLQKVIYALAKVGVLEETVNVPFSKETIKKAVESAGFPVIETFKREEVEDVIFGEKREPVSVPSQDSAVILTALFEELRKINTEQTEMLSGSKSEIECQVCFDIGDVGDKHAFVKLPCVHYQCRRCQYTQGKIIKAEISQCEQKPESHISIKLAGCPSCGVYCLTKDNSFHPIKTFIEARKEEPNAKYRICRECENCFVAGYYPCDPKQPMELLRQTCDSCCKIPLSVKNCPGTCGYTITRKPGTCRRMYCPHCDTHWCWVCSEVFDGSSGIHPHDEIYNHLVSEHTGIFSENNLTETDQTV